MKNALLLVLALSLSGCSALFKPEVAQPVAIKYKYVITTVPSSMFEVPAPMYKIDVEKATDEEASQWMIDSEKRAQEIERRLLKVKEFIDLKIKSMKLLPEDVIVN